MCGFIMQWLVGFLTVCVCLFHNLLLESIFALISKLLRRIEIKQMCIFYENASIE